MRSILPLAGLASLATLSALSAAAQPILLEDIVLSANREQSAAARTGASVSVLDAPDLQASGRPFVLDQIQAAPGVSTQQTGPEGTVSGFTVRGLPQEYVRVQVEGIEISDPTGTQVAPSLSGLLVDDVSRIEVLRGSQSALYGGQAVGGVLTISAPRATEPGLRQRALLEGGSFDSFRGVYGLAGLGKAGEFALTVARYETDGFSAAEEADGNTEKDGYRTTRLSGSGRFILGPSSTAFASGFWQREDVEFDAGPGPGGDAPNTSDRDSWGARAGLALATDAGGEHTLALSYFDVERAETTFFPGFGGSTADYRGDRTRAEYLLSYDLSDRLGVQLGADYARETSESTFSARESTWIAGAFAQADWTPADPLTLNAALRYDEHSEFGGFPTGRLTAAYLLTPETTLRGSVGTGFRAPSNYELFARFDPTVPGPGDPELKPETSLSADIGLTRRFADRGEVSATLFWIEVDDLIQYDFATNRYLQTDGAARSRGLELAARWEASRLLTLAGSYTYTDAEQAGGARRNRVPRHDLALALQGTLAERLTWNLGANAFFDYVDETGVESAAFEENFVVVNARLAYALTDRAEVYLRAANLFDEQYQTARGYSAADRALYAGVAARF